MTDMEQVCEEETKCFKIDKSLLEKLVLKIDQTFDMGLSDDAEIVKKSSIKMYITHLSTLPSGSESGCFYSIDLGGTKLRFIILNIQGESIDFKSFIYDVPESALSGTSDQLFDFIANSVKESFIKNGDKIDSAIPQIGFTFSFPCQQTALNSGILVRWTKTYTTKGVVGQDVVKLLKNSCDKIGLKVEDFVLINDTTGTLLCGAFVDTDTVIGIINGTGTNACYIEDIDKIKKWKGDKNLKQMLINTEWGAFGENGELDDVSTVYDKEIDKKSNNLGQQIYEKMMSGMYVGELVRLALIKISERVSLFENGVPEAMKQPNSFSSSLLSEAYVKEDFVKYFKESFDYTLNDNEYKIISNICDLVALRSARLTSVGLVAALRRVKSKRCVIAGDGSMFTKHPKFVTYVEETIQELDCGKEFKVILVDDGSGKGAAFAACLAQSG